MNTTELRELINLRFTLDQECPVDKYLANGFITEYFPQDNGTYQVIIKDVDEVLIECLNPDDLAGFFGIQPEFLIAVEEVI